MDCERFREAPPVDFATFIGWVIPEGCGEAPRLAQTRLAAAQRHSLMRR
jgi:hypothetical protein